jgi:hypothetical protein
MPDMYRCLLFDDKCEVELVWTRKRMAIVPHQERR